jgi:hypothetical protein
MPSPQFLEILYSHLQALAAEGHDPSALRISETEAGRCGIAEVTDATTIFGVPLWIDNSVALGRVRLDRSLRPPYEFALPVYFEEA